MRRLLPLLAVAVLTACASGPSVSIVGSGSSQLAADTARFDLFGPADEFATEVLGSGDELVWHGDNFRDGADRPATALTCDLVPPDGEGGAQFGVSIWQGEMGEADGYAIKSKTVDGFAAITSSVHVVRPDQVDAIKAALDDAVERIEP